MKKQLILLVLLACLQIICSTLAYVILITPAWIHVEHDGVEYDYGIFEGCITKSAKETINDQSYDAECSYCRQTTEINFHEGVDYKELDISKAFAIVSLVSRVILLVTLVLCTVMAFCGKFMGAKAVFIITAIFGIIQIASYVVAVVFTMRFFNQVDTLNAIQGNDEIEVKLTNFGYGMLLAWINCGVEFIVFILLVVIAIQMLRDSQPKY